MTVRRYPHQFRFQVISAWLADNYSPRRTLDVGGGKGLLAYLLNLRGWDVSVIDPVDQTLPPKYKDLALDKRILIPTSSKVNRITAPFEEDMANGFDLLIGLHAHGSNIKILNVASKHHKDFLILPCCVIDEPIEVKGGINWMDSLEIYAKNLGLPVKRKVFNFVRQSTALYFIGG
jgi:hypothetical protein